MTREEQIRAAAIQQCLGSSSTAERKRRKWIEGAKWADAHPINSWKDAQGEDLPVYKTFTDIEQSKRLAEILPIESADGYYEAQLNPKTENWEYVLFPGNEWASPEVVIPAWSLAVLLYILPKSTIIKVKECYCVMVEEYGIRTVASNLTDACVEMIVQLHKDKKL